MFFRGRLHFLDFFIFPLSPSSTTRRRQQIISMISTHKKHIYWYFIDAVAYFFLNSLFVREDKFWMCCWVLCHLQEFNPVAFIKFLNKFIIFKNWILANKKLKFHCINHCLPLAMESRKIEKAKNKKKTERDRTAGEEWRSKWDECGTKTHYA